jgi:hypothetical protein
MNLGARLHHTATWAEMEPRKQSLEIAIGS